MLLLVLIVPNLPARLRDELVQAQVTLLQHSAKVVEMALHHLVVVAHVPEQDLLRVVQQLVDPVVEQLAPETLMLRLLTPHRLHFLL